MSSESQLGEHCSWLGLGLASGQVYESREPARRALFMGELANRGTGLKNSQIAPNRTIYSRIFWPKGVGKPSGVKRMSKHSIEPVGGVGRVHSRRRRAAR